MDAMEWIELLAARARNEAVPAVRVAPPRIQPPTYWGPRLALPLSAAASLLLASLLLAMGIHAQRRAAAPRPDSSDTMSVLFAPLEMN